MAKFYVVIADDHKWVRSGIRNIIGKLSDVVVVGEASTGYEALRLIEEQKPDLLLLDLNMPECDGVEVVRRLHDLGATTLILVLSAIKDREMILGMLDMGVAGYLTKDEAPEKLLAAIREFAAAKAAQQILVNKVESGGKISATRVFPE